LAAALATDQGARCRFVFIRGVQWSAPDIHMMSVSSALMNFWPTPMSAVAPAAHASDSFSDDGGDLEENGSTWQANHDKAALIVSHAGVTQLASDLYKQLKPFLTTPDSTHEVRNDSVPTVAAVTSQTETPPPPLFIAGHSLGGALGMLLMAQTLLSGHRRSQGVHCYTFGSPPVLAHRDGGGGHRVMQVGAYVCIALSERSLLSVLHDGSTA
jgi:hypothetical protein